MDLAHTGGERIRCAAATVAIGILSVLAIWAQAPPRVAPVDAPASAFSARRAAILLRGLASVTHPTGSRAAAGVREQVAARLRQLGMEVTVQDAVAFRQDGRGVVHAASVCNLAGRLRGTSGRRNGAVLLCAHTDTVPHSPGASDDGAAVAALLETARALRAGPPLRRDVIFLFTDGEELGLLGARAFVKSHPWARDVGIVLNFEARGSRGASYMFETSPRNGELIRLFLRSTPYPAASSLMDTLYQQLPNDTDFSIFRAAGVPGYNFAYVDGLQYYHSANDSLNKLDLRSLQHHGSYALSLTRALASLRVLPAPAPDRVYFNVVGGWTAEYPARLARPLALAVTLLFLATVAEGLRRGRIRIGWIAQGGARLLLALVAAPAMVQVLWALIRLLRPGTTWSTHAAMYGTAFACLAAAITLWLLAARVSTGRAVPDGGTEPVDVAPPEERQVTRDSLAVGALTPWLALALVTGFWLPGASYLFSWPLLFAAGAMAVRFRVRRMDRGLDLLVGWTGIIPAVLLLAPTVYALLTLLSLLLPAILMAPVVLTTALLFPVLDEPAVAPGRTAALVLAAAGGTLLLVAFFRPLYQDGSQIRDTMIHVNDAARHDAFWLTTDGHLDEWSRRFIPTPMPENALERYFPFRVLVPAAARRRFLTGPAPSAPLQPPEVTVEREERSANSRVVWLRLRSRRAARTLAFFLDPKAVVLEAELCGERVPGATPGIRLFTLVFTGPPPSGVSLKLKLASDRPVGALLVDASDGLPALPGRPERPFRLIPTSWSDQTVVVQPRTF